MASDLVDGDYLGSYRRFIVDFLDKVNPNDQLPIKTSGYDVSEEELVGEIIHMTLQYLNQPLCPPSLQCHIVKLVVDEINATCRKQPETCGFRQEEKTYAPLKLMRAVASKVNEICQRYLENSRLALLPPPPSTPVPLANAFAIRNNRRKMEDRHVILHDLNAIFNIESDSMANYYAVFDGHTGFEAAVFCATHLHRYLIESPHYPRDPERALRHAFTTADETFIKKAHRLTVSSGTTAVCALILNKKLYVAWVGDSQAALAKRGTVTQLVESHNPTRNDERERIMAMDGCVLQTRDGWRVNGNLAVSRAIGDAQYKPFVSGDPDIRCINLDGDEDFLIIGCDGLWDCVTENEAAALVYRNLYRDPYDYDSASQRLVELAKNQGSLDNITVIVVFLSPPAKISSRSSKNVNPLVADVQLDNMEPDNRFVSNANGQFDVNKIFVKQTSASNNLSPDLMDDDDSFVNYDNKSSNGMRHENGDKIVETTNYHGEVDDDDLGPETNVDAVDDACDNESNLANVSRQLFTEKQDPREIYENEERMDDEKPSSPQANETNQQALIPETDNVGDSEDSEDEWNYYRIDPNKEKEAASASAAIIQEPKLDKVEGVDEIGAGASSPTENLRLLADEDDEEDEVNDNNDDDDDEKNDSDSSSEPDSEREIRSNALIDNEISAERNFEPIDIPTADEKTDDKETEKFDQDKSPELSSKISSKPDSTREDEEDMDFQLNPNAAEFVPVSPTPIISTRMDLADAPIAGSPLKQTPTMDDIAVPSRREFETEVRNRPCEIDEKSPCKNGDLFGDLEDDEGPQMPVATAITNLDESEVSSTRAEFGDDTSFLTINEFPKTEMSNLEGSWTNTYGGMDDSNVDPMTKSFGPGDFMNLGNPVDLNAVHDLPDDDFMTDDNNEDSNVVAEDEKKMNLENTKTTIDDNVESSNVDDTNFDPFSNRETSNIMDASSPVLSPSSPMSEMYFGNVATEHRTDSPVTTVMEAERVAKEIEIPITEVANDVTSSQQPLVDDKNVTSKLLAMDLEDRGSQDCEFEKCNEKIVNNDVESAKSQDVEDFLSSPVPRDDFVGFTANDNHSPIETTKSDAIVDEITESFDQLRTNDDKDEKINSTTELPILLNPLNLHTDNTRNSRDNGSYEDIPDYEVPKAADSPIDIISPLVQSEQQKNNPFQTPDFGSELSFGGHCQNEQSKIQDSEINVETVEPEIAKIEPSVDNHDDDDDHNDDYNPVESTEITSTLKLSESLQEFTGLEEQLNPAVDNQNFTNGITSENLLDVSVNDNKVVAEPMKISEPVETIVEPPVSVETTKEPSEDDKKVEIPTEAEPENLEKENVSMGVAAAAVAVAATASTVATVTAASTKAPAKSSKPSSTKITTKTVAQTKSTTNKSTPTSPTKPTLASRATSATVAKKTASTTIAASRPSKLETGKSSSTVTKTSTGAIKSTTSSTAPKTAGRLSTLPPRTKPVASSVSKSSIVNADKKPTTNGDATKSSSNKITAAKSTTTASTKPPIKSSTTRVASSSSTTTSTTARARATSAAVTSTATKLASSKTTTGNVGTTTQRPKTAPSTTGTATANLAAKSRLMSNPKSPITDKQIKETANKQISSSRTSTTTTASKTSRTSVTSSSSSSTTTTMRRSAASKTTTSTTPATQTVPPPIRKPAPITRPPGKTVVTSTANVPTIANGKITKTVATNKTKVVVENGVCTAAQESKIVTSTTSNNDDNEDLPKKDVSPVEPSNDNQLVAAAD